MTDQELMREAYLEALAGVKEGGLPIGSVLAIDGEIVSRGHNQRVQMGSVIRHAEMDCLERAGRLTSQDYARSVLYSTLSPCDMCSGAVLLYKIPRVVIGENVNFQGPEAYVRSRGILIDLLDDPNCIALMRDFVARHPTLWNEDIGV
jgi:cytosine deaminase